MGSAQPPGATYSSGAFSLIPASLCPQPLAPPAQLLSAEDWEQRTGTEEKGQAELSEEQAGRRGPGQNGSL